MGYDVFISYASENQQKAKTILDHLKSQGFRCWIDTQDLRFTRKYDHEIEQAIKNSRIVLWLASPQSIASDYVKFEIATASNLKKTIGPIYLEPMDPARLPAPFNLKLANVQGIEWFKGPQEENLKKLALELRRLISEQKTKRRIQQLVCAFVLIAIIAVVGAWTFISSMKPEGAYRSSANATTPWVMPAPKSLPAQLSGIPAAGILQIAYNHVPPGAPTASERPSLQLAILVRRQGESSFSSLKDGDSLASEKDDYFVVLRPLSRGFLYVFQIDSQGNKSWLFPKNDTSPYSSGSNPVKSEEIVQTPSAESPKVLYLDRNTGVEHLYAVFSSTQWPDLEQALANPGPNAPETKPSNADLLAADIRSPNGMLNRGVGGVRDEESLKNISMKFTVERTEKDHTLSLPVSTEPLQSTGSFMVIERWFRHVNPE
jgi:hypothetical protein